MGGRELAGRRGGDWTEGRGKTPPPAPPVASEPSDDSQIVTINPATGSELATYPVHRWSDVDRLLDGASEAAGGWREVPRKSQSALLRRVGTILRQRREEFAELITNEMGKPIAEARAEIDKCSWNCDVVAEHTAQWLADQAIAGPGTSSWVSYEPLGVILAVMPWNYPFWQVLRFACAAVAAGNAAVLKHAPNVTGSALAIEQVFTEAGAPEGLFTSLVIAPAQVGDIVGRLVADPRVAAVTLTGSDRAGASVGAAAGEALKPSVLELGGSDPFVVLAGADLPAAAAAAVKSRFGNAGQSCIAAKRFIVEEAVADEFVTLLAQRVGDLIVGDPRDDATQVGPMARLDLREALQGQVERSVAAGAKVAVGNTVPEGPGWFYAPTVLDHVTPGMAVFREETFGPVAAVVRARDVEDCVRLANDTVYGLGASVWGPAEQALAVGRRIRSGGLFVNTIVASDPRLPFGGVGRSGYGRELAAEGLRAFTNVRTVVVGGPAPAGSTTGALAGAE